MNKGIAPKISAFFSKYKKVHFKKRENILFAGDVPQHVFYIVKGYARSYITTSDGREFTARLYKPSDVFSLRAAIYSRAASHNYQGLTEIDAIQAPKDDFLKFLNENPEVYFEITKNALQKLNDIIRRLEIIVIGSAHQKINTLLVFLAEGLGEVDKDGINIRVPFTHQELATMTGLTRETVTLEISRLDNMGLISKKDRKLKILNLSQIKKSVNLISSSS